MSFRNYIKSQEISGLRPGHFLWDAKNDPKFPEGRSWEEVEDHLAGWGPKPEVVDYARGIWAEYQESLKPRG